jgi:glyoxylase-like metal-dependent hydrolase (beta-lactamase superfamily II)
MYELIQAGESTFYIQCPAKIGIYRTNGTDVYLIDSGNDKDAGRKVRQILDKNGWRLKAVLNTHSNADHVGGNRYLQSQYGCDIFASGAEAAFTRRPLLEPSLIYGGYPFEGLRNKFLMAQPSDARDVADPGFPKEIGVIPLPGHFIDMVGFRTPDDVVFLADCVASGATLQKYGVTFLYDIGAQLKTLDAVEAMEAALFVPAHADAAADIKALVRLNRDKTLEIADVLAGLCETPLIFEDILQRIFTHYGLTMSDSQYVLVGSTVRSYLSWLRDTGRLAVNYDNNKMLWSRA